MFTEIEAKLRVDSLQQVADLLVECGAEFETEQLQTDYYFDNVERTLTKADNCLRIRRQIAGGAEKIILTFKGPKAKTQLKRRDEIEIAIDDIDAGVKMMESLDYKRVLVLQKRRQLWKLDNCEVALDELPVLGKFVEIEGPSEENIREVQSKLGLAELEHIRESYAELITAETPGGKNKRAEFYLV